MFRDNPRKTKCFGSSSPHPPNPATDFVVFIWFSAQMWRASEVWRGRLGRLLGAPRARLLAHSPDRCYAELWFGRGLPMHVEDVRAQVGPADFARVAARAPPGAFFGAPRTSFFDGLVGNNVTATRQPRAKQCFLPTLRAVLRCLLGSTGNVSPVRRSPLLPALQIARRICSPACPARGCGRNPPATATTGWRPAPVVVGRHGRDALWDSNMPTV